MPVGQPCSFDNMRLPRTQRRLVTAMDTGHHPRGQSHLFVSPSNDGVAGTSTPAAARRCQWGQCGSMGVNGVKSRLSTFSSRLNLFVASTLRKLVLRVHPAVAKTLGFQGFAC